MQKLPIGIQDFGELRGGGYLYVDKTELIFRLIDSGKYYFLSRPRRFGKSLLISTLRELFLGNKDLFEGLWIKDRYEFVPHPVIHIAFTTDQPEALAKRMMYGGAVQVGKTRTEKNGDVIIDMYDPNKVPIRLIKRKKPIL